MPFVSPDVSPGTNDPKRNVVAIVYARMTESVKAQVVRDFLLLSGEFAVSYSDKEGLMDKRLMDALNVTEAVPGSPIDLYIVYKVDDVWPTTPPDVVRVERDLCPDDASPKLSGESGVGYYIKPQGRTGANLTLRYLSRAYPRGRGFVQPWLLN